jgi:hypothetical protein
MKQLALDVGGGMPKNFSAIFCNFFLKAIFKGSFILRSIIIFL